MTTVSKLISKLESLNCRFEYFTKIDRDTLPVYNTSDGSLCFVKRFRPTETVFGLEYRPWLWVWFVVLEDGTAICVEVYSMRTGRSDKSFRRRFAVENSLLK